MVKSSTTHNYLNSKWPGRSYWIGVHDITTEGKFEYVESFPITVSYWKPGEPNNVGGEDCVHYKKGGWNDEPCYNTRDYLCQMSIP